ncbi:MAG: RNA 2',3'-cyclic phosphodiesterase, partial [Lentisphaeria bacterium]
IMRTFIAAEIPETLQNHIVSLQEYLHEHGVKAKWIDQQNCHFTLLFLGEQAQEQIETLKTDLQRRADELRPIELEYVGVNTFRKKPRVLFLEYQAMITSSFAELVENLRLICDDAGIKIPDDTIKKEPRPHLTIARFKKRHDTSALQQIAPWKTGRRDWLCELPEPGTENRKLKISAITLLQSVLRQGGAQYMPLERLELKTETS